MAQAAPESPAGKPPKMQLVAKDHGKRARSFAFGALRSSDQSDLLEGCVSLHWSEGSSRRTSCSDLGVPSSEWVLCDGEMVLPGGGRYAPPAAKVLDGAQVESWLRKKAVFCLSMEGFQCKAVFSWDAWRKALLGLFFAIFLFYIVSGLAPVQDVARLSGALDCLVITTKYSGGIGRVMALHLLQNLIKNNAKNAERIVDQGFGKSLRAILKSERLWMTEELKVASSSTIAGLVAELPSPKASLLLSDTVQGVFDVIQNSDSSREKTTMLETLAILMKTSGGSIAGHIVYANGEELLIDILRHGTSSEVVASTWALGNLWASQANCNLVQQTGGVSTLVSLLDSPENKMGAHIALLALGNLLISCPDFKTIEETRDLMDVLVRLLEGTVDPNLSIWKLHVTSVATNKIAKIRTSMQEEKMEPGTIDDLFTSEAPMHTSIPGQFQTNPEDFGETRMSCREPGTFLKNLIIAVGLIDELIGRPTNQIWFADDAKYLIETSAVRLKDSQILSEARLAARASWVVGILGARNAHQQTTLRQAGGIEVLVKLVDSSLVNPLGGQYAALALANVVADSAENKNALVQTSGVEVMMHLISLNHDGNLAMSALTCLKATIWGANQFAHSNNPANLEIQLSSSHLQCPLNTDDIIWFR